MSKRKDKEDNKRKQEDEHIRLLKGMTKRKKLAKETGCYEMKDVKLSYRHGTISHSIYLLIRICVYICIYVCVILFHDFICFHRFFHLV